MNVVILRDRVTDASSADELDVLAQTDSVSRALRELGHEPQVLECALDLQRVANALQAAKPDLVFNLVESVEGHGRLIHLAPSLLDTLAIPYTGACAEAVFLTSNKLLAKQTLRAAGIATPPWVTLRQLAGGGLRVNRPHLIKSQWEHASISVSDQSIVAPEGAPAAAGARLAERLRQADGAVRGGCYAEEYIEGREFNLSLLAVAGARQPEVLPPAEIRFLDYPADKPRIVGYAAKWDADSFEYSHTPRSFDASAADRPLLDTLARIAVETWELFELRGYARVDFRVDAAGKPWVLEVNINPCLAPDAGFAAAVQCAGLTYTQAIARIVADSLPQRSR